MKFLGLMGVLLWLGTLLGLAGGEERTRVDLAVLEKDTVGIGAPPFLGATKCDAEKKHFVEKAPLAGAEMVAHVSPRLRVLPGRVGSSVRVARSAPLEAWRLGQGPPQA